MVSFFLYKIRRWQKVATPHTHLGYLHLEGGTRERMTVAESKLIEKVLNMWENHMGKL